MVRGERRATKARLTVSRAAARSQHATQGSAKLRCDMCGEQIGRPNTSLDAFAKGRAISTKVEIAAIPNAV